MMRVPTLTLDDAGDAVHHAVRDPGHHCGAGAADLHATTAPPSSTCRRRRSIAVAAPVLDLRSPGGVHPDPARLRDRVRGAPGVRPQAAVRLSVRRPLGRGHRLHGLRRVGAPHVRLGARADQRGGVLRVEHGHRHSHRREDHQLDAHPLERQAPLRHTRCCSPSVSSSCSRWVACRVSPTRYLHRTPSRPTPTTSWPTSTTCCSVGR